MYNFGRPKSTSFSGETNQNSTFKQNHSLFGSTNTSTFGNTSSPFDMSKFGQTSSKNSSILNKMVCGDNTLDLEKKTFGSTNNSIFNEENSTQMEIANDQSTEIFGGTSSFTNVKDQIGTPTKFIPLKQNEYTYKGGISQTLTLSFQSITYMKEYENKSFEELRLEDYELNRKGVQQSFLISTPQTSNTVPFFKSSTSTVIPALGQQENLFGRKTSGTSFGQINSPFSITSSKNNNSGLFNNTTGFSSTPPFSQFSSNVQSNDLFKNNTSLNTIGLSAQPSIKPSFGSNQSPIFNSKANNKKVCFNLGHTSSNNNSDNPFIQSSFGASTNASSLTSPLFGQSNQPKTFNFSSNVGTTLFNQQQKSNSLGGGGFPINVGTPAFGNNVNNNFNSSLFGNTNSICLPNTQLNSPQSTSLLSLSNQNQSNFDKQQQLMSMLSTPYGTTNILHNFSENEVKQYTSMTNPDELNRVLKNVLNPRPEKKKNEIKIASLKVPQTNNSIFTGLEFPDEQLNANIRINKHPKRLILRKKIGEESVCNNTDQVTNMKLYGNNTTVSNTENLENDISNDSEIYYDSESYGNTSVIQTKLKNLTTSTFYTNVIFEKSMENENNLNQLIDIDKVMYPEKQTESSEMNLSPIIEESPVNTIYFPHPTGIILTRPDYYTLPSLDELANFINKDGSCFVQGFTIGRYGYGNVYFPDTFDVCKLNLDELVHFTYREITIYPDDSKKPPIGEGLNRKAQVTLDGVFPRDKKTKELITDVDSLMKINYSNKLIKICQKQGINFLDYRPETGSWVFKVYHF